MRWPPGPSVNFTHTPGGGGRIVRPIPETEGGVFETAIVRATAQPESSRLFPAVSSLTELDDLVLILSFLTGRQVYLLADINKNKFLKINYSDGAVARNFFRIPQDFWSKLDRVYQHGASTAIEALVQTHGPTDLIGMAAYANCALDVLSGGWLRDHGQSTYADSSLLKAAKERSIHLVTKSLYGRICAKLLQLLTQNGAGQDVIQDISARLGGVLQPSALYKLKAFLQGIDLYPRKESKESWDRLRRLNMIRNRAVHTGDIPRDKGTTFEDAARIALAVILLEIDIAEIYIVKHLLQLEDWRTDRSEQDIRRFFENGVFRGQRVFEETYEAFLQRAEEAWVNEGQFLD